MITLLFGQEREKVLAAFAIYESEKNYQLDVPRTIYGMNFSHEYQTLFDPVISELLHSDHYLFYADNYSLFMQDCFDYYGKRIKKYEKLVKKQNIFLVLMGRSARKNVDFYVSCPLFTDFNSTIRRKMTAKIECKKVNGHIVGDYVLLRTNEKSRIVLD